MAFGRKALTASAETKAQQPKSLVASAIRTSLSDLSYNLWKFRDEGWQRELWRFYDIIPEFAFAARWVGACCSRVRIYVAEVDKLGRVQGEVKDSRVNALADSLLGGPAAKAEALRSLGINLSVAGESYIVGKPGDPSGETSDSPRDEWFVLSPSEMRRVNGSNGEMQWAWYMPDGSAWNIDIKQNVITRVWTPHPNRYWCADSPAHACQMILRELEQLTKYIFSQIDSRLVGAGLMIIPNNVDMPLEPGTTTPSDSLMVRLAKAGAASLRGEGSALGVLPNIVESDNAEGWKLLTFESQLSQQAMDLRKEAVNRLGVGLDMPPEVLQGTGDANHWSAYLIDGQGIKVHIEPLMNRICDALTKAYLIPALRIMGKDPSRYTYAYDTSPLQLRPQRFQDALNLYDKQVISAQALREAGYFKESDSPDVDEDMERFFRELIMRNTELLQNEAIREAAGVPQDIVSQEDMVAALPPEMGGPPPPDQAGLPGPNGESLGMNGPPPPPPPPPTGVKSALPPPIPDSINSPNMGSQRGMPTAPTGIQASAADRRQMEEMAVVVVAEATVRRGLELAGKRLLDRDTRNQFRDVPAHELHTRIKVEDQARVARLLYGAWDQLPALTSLVASSFDADPLRICLERYCSHLLLTGTHHVPELLLERLRKEGVVSAI
jgi:hypothetical protein